MTPTDPSPDVLFSLYHSGAFLCLGIVAAYLALRYASSHIAWLEVPGRAHYIAAVLGGLALIIGPISQGTTPNASMLMTAGSAVVALFLRGVQHDGDPKQAQAGFARLGLVVIVAVFGVVVVGCAWFKSESKAVASDVVDCTKATAVGAIKEFGPAIDALLLYATGANGVVSADAVKDAGKGFAKEIGGCVLADSIARALKPSLPDPNAPKSSPLVADPDSLRRALATLQPGVKFHTASGDL
jgi:hypothetical protein